MTDHNAHETLISISGFVLLMVPFFTYYKLIETTHMGLIRKTLRISVLSCRTAVFLPAYSICMWFSLIIPSLYLPLQILVSVAEGYCFFSFFAMITSNLGGCQKTSYILTDLYRDGKRPLIAYCCPNNGPSFYHRVYNALWHFLNTRTVFVTITSILQMFVHYDDSISDHGIKVLRVFAYLFTLVAFLLLANGFSSLVFFYEMLYTNSSNVGGTFKILLLKFSVGLIVIQGLLEEFLFATGYIKIADSDTFSSEQRAQRLYCLLVIFEYAFLAIAVYYAYSVPILPHEESSVVAVAAETMTPNNGDGKSSQLEVSGGDSVDASIFSQNRVSGHDGNINGYEPVNITFKEYVDMIFNLRDVWDDLELLSSGSSDSSSLRQPLTRADEADNNYHKMADGGNVV